MELLIKAINEPYNSLKEKKNLFHRGDVIAAMPDDHKWSNREKTNPKWLIIQVQITPVEVDALLASEVDLLGVKKSKYKRAKNINLSLLLDGINKEISKNNVLVLNSLELKKFRSLEVIKGAK